MTDSRNATSKLTRFYGELSPSLETVKEALAFAGVDTDHPQARDLYSRDIDCHNLGMHRMLQLAADVASEYGEPGPAETILDLGCGLGGPGRFLADRFGCSVLGIDLLPLRIELAQALAEMTDTTDRVSYRVADATDLDLPDSSFAQVWMLDVSMHIRNKRALFGEIARVLQPGGLLVMHEQTGPLPPSMRPLMRQAPYIAPTLPQLIRYIETDGLRLLTWRDTTPVVIDYFLAMRDLVLETSEPRNSRRQTGIPLLDAYLETLSEQGGRTGMLIARRV
jgi:ubiquinone/menaquinone biosynthesis C-methylase UbiE